MAMSVCLQIVGALLSAAAPPRRNAYQIDVQTHAVFGD